MNYNPQSMLEIIEGDGYEVIISSATSPSSLHLNCADLVPYCSFCVNYQCINCYDNYYLVDGVCLLCNDHYTRIGEACVEHSEIYLTDTINQAVVYDAS